MAVAAGEVCVAVPFDESARILASRVEFVVARGGGFSRTSLSAFAR